MMNFLFESVHLNAVCPVCEERTDVGVYRFYLSRDLLSWTDVHICEACLRIKAEELADEVRSHVTS